MKQIKSPKAFGESLVFIILTVTGLFFEGCDKVCHDTKNDVATVRNQTGRTLSLSVCKGSGLKQQVQISADQVGVASLGQSTTQRILGGGDALRSCNGPSDQSQAVSFSLSAESFNDVTLCRDVTTLQYTVVDRSQPCPSGNQSQSNPANCP